METMMTKKQSAENIVRDIRRATRLNYSTEEKIRIALEGLWGEDSIDELCRRVFRGTIISRIFRGIHTFVEGFRESEYLLHGRRFLVGILSPDLSVYHYF